MSALLTDEAVRAACASYSPYDADAQRLIRLDLEAFLRYHRTVGREALVEKVAEALCARWPQDTHAELRKDAEAVVTALVGAAPTEAKQP